MIGEMEEVVVVVAVVEGVVEVVVGRDEVVTTGEDVEDVEEVEEVEDVDVVGGGDAYCVVWSAESVWSG